MPSTYAHYLFGKKVLENLTIQQKNFIEKNRDLYDIGLHGPDILFYYHPLKSNPINRWGYAMHEKKGSDFFEKARSIASQVKENEKDLAYLYGFICHFALDARCHPYVEKYVREKSISHTKIEVAFDMYLLQQNHIQPAKYHLSKHIHPSKKAGETICAYFENTTPKIIEGALQEMNFYHHLLHASNSFKREVLYTGMNIVHQSGFKDQILPKQINPQCHKSNQDLDALLQLAIDDACLLIDEFEKNLHTHQPLNKLYEHTFGEN